MNDSVAILVPFLNGATWLHNFITHTEEIINRNNNSRLFLIEGVTSFNTASENDGNRSVDGSEEIIRAFDNDKIIYMPKGRVDQITELVSEGYRHATMQNYVWILSIHDFINPYLFDEVIKRASSDDVLSIHSNNLSGDFRHSKHESLSSSTTLFKNIQGFHFKDGIRLPHLKNTIATEVDGLRCDEITKDSNFMLNVEYVCTKNQFCRKFVRDFRYAKWYHNNINLIPGYKEYDPFQFSLEKAESFENTELEIEYKLNSEIFEEHPWFNLDRNEIWNFSITFPSFDSNSLSGKKLVQISGLTKKKGKALEIGCATGSMLKFLSSSGWDVSGIEPSKWASGYAKYINEINVNCGVIGDAEYEDKEFDLIYFWDSFEHIGDPIAALLAVSKWLKSDGVIIIYTPDFNKFGDDKKHWLWSPLQHYFLYTSETLVPMMIKCGYDILRVDNDVDPNGFLITARRSK